MRAGLARDEVGTFSIDRACQFAIASKLAPTVIQMFQFLRGNKHDPPQTMTQIEITQPGAPEVLQPRQVPLPVAGPGEVLIRVHAAGVNRPDVQRAGKYPMKPGMNPIPLEVAGEVVALGSASVTSWSATKSAR
jgi:threonine dehydrogenase-like Zn-dependent dehydrogenase